MPEVLGSSSTDQKAGMGGHEGRLLRDGDRLRIKTSTRHFTTTQGVKQLLWGNVIRALPGPEYHEFDEAAKESFWRSPWKISPQSNRMGYRLQGQPLTRTTDRELLSHGLLPGVIQVPGNGQPIVLMNDAQTTGDIRVLPALSKRIATIWRKFLSASPFILCSVRWRRR